MNSESFVYGRIELLEKRFQEVNILLQEALAKISDNEIYSTFCRSAHILLVAHFEGLIKDFTKDVLDDINANCDFKSAPVAIKRTFCEHFIKKENSGDFDEKIKNRLVDTFDELPIKFKVDPFLFENNKNPSPQMLQTILAKFGVKNFIWNLKGSDLDIVFENNKTDIHVILNKIRNHVKEGTKSYPYSLDEKIYNPDLEIRNKPGKKTLWDNFLEDFLKNRHSIVHGNILENPTDHEEIEMSKDKVEILLYSFVISICNASIPKVI